MGIFIFLTDVKGDYAFFFGYIVATADDILYSAPRF